MSEQTKSLVVKVEGHGKPEYAKEDPYKLALRFQGIQGLWVLSGKTRDELRGKSAPWPPQPGAMLAVELHYKPNPGHNPYRDINSVTYRVPEGATLQTWAPEADDPAPPPKPATGTAPQQQRTHDTDTNRSIGRQVVVKAEAEVLCRGLVMSEAGEGYPSLLTGLYEDWRRHCAELWGEPQAPGKPLVTGVTEEEPGQDTGGLGGDEIPFAPSVL